MANKLRECVLELHKNNTGVEVSQAFSEYFRTVENVAEAYADNATVEDLSEECPNLNFMTYAELETLLEHAKTWRHKSDGQEPGQPERGPDEADGKPQGAEGLFRKRMLAYAHMIARNRRDETEALLSALADEPLEAKYKDYWDCWGDEEPEGGETI